MKRFYRFAGCEICLDIPDSIGFSNEHRLQNFRVDQVDSAWVYHFEAVDSLQQPEGKLIANTGGMRVYSSDSGSVRYLGSVAEDWKNGYIRIMGQGKEQFVQIIRSEMTDNLGCHTVLNVLGFEHLAASAGGFVFHCSFIEYKGCAILFTAPSGTGKSTQADLWNKFRGASIINGDRAVVRIYGDAVTADGIPYSGSSEYSENRSLPIRAIVYLQQAPKNAVKLVSGYEAFARIWEGVSVNTWDKQDLEAVSAIVAHVAEKVPMYVLSCTPDENAVIALERVLNREAV